MTQPLISFVLFANVPRVKFSVLSELVFNTLNSLYAQPLTAWNVQVIVCIKHFKKFQKNVENRESQNFQDSRVQWWPVGKSTLCCQSLSNMFKKSKGEWLGFLHAGDVLREDFVYWVYKSVLSFNKNTKVIRFESKCSNGAPTPALKPLWSHDLQWEANYLDNDFVVKKNIAQRILKVLPTNVLNPLTSLSMLVNRLVISTNAVRAVKHCLLSKQMHSPSRIRLLITSAIKEQQRDLQSLLQNSTPGTKVKQRLGTHWFQIDWPLPKTLPFVHIVIPTHDQPQILKKCVDSLLKYTQYPNLSITVVDNATTDLQALRYLKQLPAQAERKGIKLNVVKDPQPFNFSALNNVAVKYTKKGVLVFLNNDIEIHCSDWLFKMVHHAVRPNVGCVGVKLSYPDGSIQHLGVQLGVDNIASHIYRSVDPKVWPTDDPILSCTSNPIAVTAAVMAIRAETFHRLGGFDQKHLAVAYNDVDLCLKAYSSGLVNVCLADVSLTHLESASRVSAETQNDDSFFNYRRERQESNLMRQRWATLLASSSGNFIQ